MKNLNNMNNNVNTWIITDDGQMVYCVNSQLWWVAQIHYWEDDYCVSLDLIDLDCYDEEDVTTVLKMFGYSGKDEVSNQLIAEMLAEDIDDFNCVFKGVFDECYNWMHKKNGLKDYANRVYGIK